MGLIHANIELVNGTDVILAKELHIGEDEIRRIEVNALVDTGSIHLAINETIRDYLGLRITERRKGRLADGTVLDFELTGPIEVHYKNRTAFVRAMVLPGDEEVLLGAMPMEEMDVIIDPVRQELLVNPESPDVAMATLKGIRPYTKSSPRPTSPSKHR
jgi:clan AA aspartic protease